MAGNSRLAESLDEQDRSLTLTQLIKHATWIGLCVPTVMLLAGCGSQQPSQAQADAMCMQLAEALSTPTMKLEVSLSGVGGTGSGGGDVKCSASFDPSRGRDPKAEIVYSWDISSSGTVKQIQGPTLPTPAPIQIPD